MPYDGFARDLALVSWNEVERHGAFVHCRRGTGEFGIWHDHEDGTDYGAHPMDRTPGPGGKWFSWKCRDCGAVTMPIYRAKK